MQGVHETLDTLRPVMDEFIKHFRDTGNIRWACEKSDVKRLQVYRWIKKYQEFKDRFEDAKKDAVDILAAEARRRALDRNAPSDRLLMFLLQAHDPEMYVPKQKTEHSGPDGGPIPVKTYSVVASPETWDEPDAKQEEG